MNIALDFDDTASRDPELWLRFARDALQSGHKIMMVTMRYPHEFCQAMQPFKDIMPIYYTSRKAKATYMFSQFIDIHVWIDDTPKWVLIDAAQ